MPTPVSSRSNSNHPGGGDGGGGDGGGEGGGGEGGGEGGAGGMNGGGEGCNAWYPSGSSEQRKASSRMRISNKKASLTPSFAEATVALGREALSRSTIATAAAVPVVQIKKASWTLAASMRKATAAC